MQNTELEALQNAAAELGLTIHQKYPNDKRQTLKRYFAQRDQETVSPVLDYEQLNHFLLGWIRGQKQTPQPAALSPADITPGEWVQGKRTDTKEWMQIFAHDKIVAEVQPINKKGNRQQGDFDKEDANVKAICTAVNSTYKKRLNPEAFEEVVNIAIRALSFVADLNGSDWIKGEGAGELDMKQRAKSLQQLLYNATQKAKL